ncbi:MAG: oxidoreductase [Acidiphilium sp.]|nr:oxidoreductase [Acidiphilium sp.]
MSKWNMIVDVALCENCHNCTLSTKDEHVDNDFPGYAAPQPRHGPDWIKITRKVRGSGTMVDAAYLPTMCNHCDDAPCIKATGGDGSIYKRPDGIVIIDPQKAKGRQDLVAACPYNAIVWNEELFLPQAWIFDAHLLDAGYKEPRASQACPTGALRAIKMTDEERQRRIEIDHLEELDPSLNTRPRVLYKNLHRFTRCFIGGSVVASVDGIEDCVADAKVTLSASSQVVAETTTDAFGDFKFDDIAPDGSSFTISIIHGEHGGHTIDVVAADSVFLGSLALEKSLR